MMHASFARLLELPDDTRVFCGHEYTESNLRFAAHVEPSNQDVVRARERAARVRANGEPTVPGTLGEERRINPFLRVTSPEIKKTLGIAADADEVTAFAAIRSAKDSFK
jgi:hydroxyacylglutathione hydrolase